MNDEKLNYVIDMIKDMDLENKLRLAICMCDNYSHTNLEYDRIQNNYCQLCKLSLYNFCIKQNYGNGFNTAK